MASAARSWASRQLASLEVRPDVAMIMSAVLVAAVQRLYILFRLDTMSCLQDVYEDDKHVHLVMELCTGGGILDRIEDHNYTERRIAQIMRSVIRSARLHCKAVARARQCTVMLHPLNSTVEVSFTRWSALHGVGSEVSQLPRHSLGLLCQCLG